jgi:flagellar hook-associated protein 3 FlgL
MRLTNKMLSTNYLTNLQRNLDRMGRQQNQLATNKRLVRLSDDPVGAVSSLAVRSKIDRIGQYQRNIEDARSRLSQSETAVMEIQELVKTAYEKAVQGATGTMGHEEREAIAVQVEALRSHLVQVANASLGDSYLFGGFHTTTPPFTVDSMGSVSYQGQSLAVDLPAFNQRIEYEIGPGLKTAVSIHGAELVGTGEQSLFNLFDGLVASLRAPGDGQQVQDSISRMQGAQSRVLALATEIGGRINRLDLIQGRYEQDQLNYQTVQSQIEDIDSAEVIMQYKMAEASYQAALAIGAKVIQPSLVDFLR